jgi:hypothetical protein
MEDGDLVEKVAREFVEQHGLDAVPILRECAEAADMNGDELAAQAWSDIAESAERIAARLSYNPKSS